VRAPMPGRSQLDEVLEHVERQSEVWVRAACVMKESRWEASLVELTAGEAPPSWSQRDWRYPDAWFTALTLAGSALADGLGSGAIPVGDGVMSLPELHATVNWERRQSRSPAPYETLDWPVVEASLAQHTSQAEPQGPLVSGSAPSFVNFFTAGACFFWLDRQPAGGLLNQGVTYRYQDQRGRINRVQITNDGVEVEVEGSALDTLILELAGDEPGSTQRLTQGPHGTSASVRFELDDGLPAGAWVLLREGDEWIDRRFLTSSLYGRVEHGVEIVVESQTRLEAFLANRENDQVEFKRQFPTTDDGKRSVMKTVAAFANQRGGSLLFGIDDDHNVVGVPAKVVDELKDQITQAVGSWVEPRPLVKFEELLTTTDPSSVVLELQVTPGLTLYGCGRPSEASDVYVRHLATTVRARPREIEEIVRSRHPDGISSPWRYQ
jgi:hypothetical protein